MPQPQISRCCDCRWTWSPGSNRFSWSWSWCWRSLVFPSFLLINLLATCGQSHAYTSIGAVALPLSFSTLLSLPRKLEQLLLLFINEFNHENVAPTLATLWQPQCSNSQSLRFNPCIFMSAAAACLSY